MIAHLKGKILKKNLKTIILGAGDIGYLVHLTAPLLLELSEEQNCEFFIHTQVREDALDLYGFAAYEDLQFFKDLIDVNGVGPKLALDIMSVPSDRIKAAILNEDLEYLKKIPGIGPKSAKRIILEIKGKIESEDRDYQGLAGINDDALEALLRLGYQKPRILKTLQELPENIKEPEEIITYFLKHS